MPAATRALPIPDEWGSPSWPARVSFGGSHVKRAYHAINGVSRNSGYVMVKHQMKAVSV
jgi:hypothetical protein